MNEPLVLLAGMLCDARLFWPQLMEFGTARAVVLAPTTGASTIGALASQALDASPRHFALVAHGLGGMVAMEMIRRAPERITRLALIGTNPLPETPQAAAEREPDIVSVRAGRLEEVVRDTLGPLRIAPGQRRSEYVNLLADMAAALGPDTFIAQSRALQRRPDQQKTLRTMKVPTMVLCGEQDAVCPVKRHEFMAELIPNAELRVIDGAGHLPTLERPDETTAAIANWLEAPLVLR